MQFKPRKTALLVEADFSADSISTLDNISNAVIIFDDIKNCLFLNYAAEKILGDRSDISILGDWIRCRTQNIVQKEAIAYKAQELPETITSICGQVLDDLEILVSKLDISDDYWQKLDNHKPLPIRGHKIKPNYLSKNYLSKHDYSGLEEIVPHVGSYDRLTGLPNHNLLLEYIDKEIVFSRQEPSYTFAVLFIDINRFKVINSSLGRILADRLLVAISDRLKTCLRSQDFIARLGNDEFAILLSNVEHLEYTTNVAERIYRKLTVPFNIGEYEVFIEASIGIALGDREYAQPENLLRDAELAVSDVRRQNKFPYQIFNQSMRGKALTLLQLENDLRRAIKREEFILHYQPIISLVDNQIKGFEVLVRWRHPEKGLIAPGKFISLAEETGLIVPLGFWVLREACQQMYTWQTKFGGLIDWKVSVNISSKQLALPNFVAQVKQILRETHLDPHNLKLEITESSLVEDAKSTIIILTELKALGIEFSLDDFGTGYSSLSYLHQFPFDTLKIDRSFVSSIGNNVEKLGIVRAIVTLARNLGMDTIAEGIETVNQLAQLKALKCQYGQGYFLSKPLDKNILENIITTEIANPKPIASEDYRLLLDEQIAKEQLLFQIEHLRQELEELKLEKADLEIMLDNTTEHADLVESQLHNEICDRQKAQAALRLANRELEKLSVLDSLTQVANRRRFDDYLIQEWQKLRQEQAPLALILCDIDYFKLYNDTYGHPIGDSCLQQVALAIECVIESIPGLVARYGGEEFGIILPHLSGEKALKVAQKIAISVNQLHIVHQQSSVSEYVTISLGVHSLIPSGEFSPELLVALADKALYEAKEQGRNQACLYVAD
ncbi:diguanylate cyclase domain-containing protein [Pleurocapsa sp. PCC 7319]|uniref:diguanylate cyclase domain-containing protein n=1 Tax=Pleurocapsa sp. PCC 7319 TaxID=118161 RepID=UPI000348371F|nr:diguanylate cyclase [Pleurocapsa sp. PCC 7319]